MVIELIGFPSGKRKDEVSQNLVIMTNNRKMYDAETTTRKRQERFVKDESDESSATETFFTFGTSNLHPERTEEQPVSPKPDDGSDDKVVQDTISVSAVLAVIIILAVVVVALYLCNKCRQHCPNNQYEVGQQELAADEDVELTKFELAADNNFNKVP